MRTLKSLIIYLVLFRFISGAVWAQQQGAPIKTSLPSDRISVIKTTHTGMVAGEYDGRTWLSPYNGLFLSKDMGTSWQPIGLSKRGITDLAYQNGNIYATTYYFQDGTTGLFISENGGNSFRHSGLSFSSSQVAASNETIYLGGYSHGLWVSKDNGFSWTQKIGDSSGWTGPAIRVIEVLDSIAVVVTDQVTYVSTDFGDTWNNITYLNGKKISQILLENNLILAGTNNNDGMYKSEDKGKTWIKLQSWGSDSSGAISRFKDNIYTCKYDPESNSYVQYFSPDNGTNWFESGHSFVNNVVSSNTVFSYPSYLFASTNFSGLYRQELSANQTIKEPIFILPWDNQPYVNPLNKISSYFDHEYPLKFYTHFDEPSYASNKTLNFLGFNKKIPDIYYSGHNGTDFYLPYGTRVLAVADGTAQYYSCKDCGHSIKIDHDSGYQTRYMHLQEEELITRSSIQIAQGEMLGKVGLSGNTSGPHLHFEVIKDSNENDSFFDDYPGGLVDPFGWQALYETDKWANYSWSDDTGIHKGSASNYLWDMQPRGTQATYISEETKTIQNGAVKITLNPAIAVDKALTAFLAPYSKPQVPSSQSVLEFVEETSFELNLYDHFSSEAQNLATTINIEIDLNSLSLEKVKENTLNLYYWDELENLWKKLDSYYDASSGILFSQSYHLSHFAVFGEKLYTLTPNTYISISGSEIEGWYTNYPRITLNVEDLNNVGIEKTLYSLDEALNWYTYTSSFLLEREGTVNILYRTLDNSGNLEETKSGIIKIDTLGKFKKEIKIISATFST